MIVRKYLIINSRGSTTLRERVPSLKGNEIAVCVEMHLPDALFQKPKLVAVLKVPSEAVPKATVTPTIATNVEKLIKEATGLEMHVTVVEHPDESKK